LARGGHRTGGDVAGARLFVDSGAWLALLSRRDQHHVEADRLFRAAAAARLRLITTNLVVAEVHRLVLFRVGIRAARAVLDRLDASRLLTVRFATAADHAAARAWLERLGDQTITYTDAVSFAVMAAERCHAALAFDRDFLVAGFRLWRG
jgi:predicted nucleic acid-binding protein